MLTKEYNSVFYKTRSFSSEFKRWMYFHYDFTPSDLYRMETVMIVYYAELYEKIYHKSAFIEN